MKLSGHTVLVTGGGAGVDMALAREFYHRNNQVIICGRNLERLDRAKQEMSNLEIMQCDLTKDDEIKSLVETLTDRFSQLSISVNNAGVQKNYKFTEIEPKTALAAIDREIMVNCNAVVKLSALCLPIANEVFEALKQNNYEIKVVKVKLLIWINRFLPKLAANILRRS